MLVAIRIRGLVGVPKRVAATLNTLRLKKKFNAVLLEESESVKGLLRKASAYLAYDRIDAKTLTALLEKRGLTSEGKPLGKIDSELVKNLLSGKVTLAEKGIKPVFRLSPPRGGFKKSTKLAFPQGVLGKNPKICDLLLRML